MPETLLRAGITAHCDSGLSKSTLAAVANALSFDVLPGPAATSKQLSADPSAYFLAGLALDRDALCLVDLAELRKSGLNLLSLSQTAKNPMDLRRVFLLNTDGHVQPGMVRFAKALGYGGISADLDPRFPNEGLKELLSWMDATVDGLQARPGRLQSYLKTVLISVSQESARSLIARYSGLSAESLCGRLQRHIEVKDRSYRLKTYPACFLGNEATQFLQEQYKLRELQAVALGNALMALGLIHHVAHAKTFAKDELFYRFSVNREIEEASLKGVWDILSEGKALEIADRSYLGVNYPNCFVGQKAIDILVAKQAMTRVHAWGVLHQFHQLHMIEHVAQQHGIIDGNFYYRLT
jgi:hypothetical protein